MENSGPRFRAPSSDVKPPHGSRPPKAETASCQSELTGSQTLLPDYSAVEYWAVAVDRHLAPLSVFGGSFEPQLRQNEMTRSIPKKSSFGVAFITRLYIPRRSSEDASK